VKANIFERGGDSSRGPLRDVLGKPSADAGSKLGSERAGDRRQSALLGIYFKAREALNELEAHGERDAEFEGEDGSAKVVRTGAQDSSRDGGRSSRGGDGIEREVDALVSSLSKEAKGGVNGHGEESASEGASLENTAKDIEEKRERAAKGGKSKDAVVKGVGEVDKATGHAIALENSEHEGMREVGKGRGVVPCKDDR